MNRPFMNAHALPDHHFVGKSDLLLRTKPAGRHDNRLQIYEDIHTWRALCKVRSNLYQNHFIERALAKLAQQRNTLITIHCVFPSKMRTDPGVSSLLPEP